MPKEKIISKADELRRARNYFKANPTKVKYSRKESGLSASFLKKNNGEIIRLASEKEEILLGKGQFGRVKSAYQNKNTSAVKIQKIKKIHEEDRGDPLKQEARINQDLRIGISPLIQRNEGDYITYYQEMHRLGLSVKDKLSEMTFFQKVNVSIDLLIAVDNLHKGITSKTNTPYSHGDIHLGNAIFSDKNELKLIDFGFTRNLKDNRSTQFLIEEDKKQALESLFNLKAEEKLFTQEEFNKLPETIKKMLNYEENPYALKHIAAALVAYKINSNITEKELKLLEKPEYQDVLIEQQTREKRIFRINDSKAKEMIGNLKKELHEYVISLNKEIKKTDQTVKENYRHELESVQRLFVILNSKTEKPQERLAKIDREIVLSFPSFDSQKTSKPSGGFLGFINRVINFFKEGVSANKIEKVISKEIGQSSIYRNKLKEIIQKPSETDSEENKQNPNNDFSV